MDGLEGHVRQEQGRSGLFTAITLDGNAVPPPALRGSGATVDRGRLTYQFTLPIRSKGAQRGTVDVVVDDPDYFIAFMLARGQRSRSRRRGHSWPSAGSSA